MRIIFFFGRREYQLSIIRFFINYIFIANLSDVRITMDIPELKCWMHVVGVPRLMGYLVLIQKLYTPSHRMFGDMHGALNIDKKITNCTVCMYFARRIILSLISIWLDTNCYSYTCATVSQKLYSLWTKHALILMCIKKPSNYIYSFKRTRLVHHPNPMYPSVSCAKFF
jgi:hypothetical protein